MLWATDINHGAEIGIQTRLDVLKTFDLHQFYSCIPLLKAYYTILYTKHLKEGLYF